MGPAWMHSFSLAGTILLFISTHAQAFVTSGRPPLGHSKTFLHGPGRGMAPVQRSQARSVLGMAEQEVEVVYDENGDINQDHILDDYQKNPKGFKDGDLVTIQSEGLKFFHIRKFKDEGLDAHGMVGRIIKLKLLSDKWPGDDGLWTANRPVFVQFLTPVKYRAHFEFGEVRRPTQEEEAAFQKLIDDAKVAEAKAQAELDAKRAAQAAAEAAAE